MNNAKQLLHYVQSYFHDYLLAHRSLSPNTVLAYRDSLKLLFSFACSRSHKSPARLELNDLQVDSALAFLDDVEIAQGNSVVTRNQRLAALRSFFNYLIAQDTQRAGQYQKVVLIPVKRGPRPLITYLEVHEVKAILVAIDLKSPSARRDYTLLSFLYNTGARVQEVVDLKLGSLHLDPPLMATLTGKGRKTRQVPLWPDTAGLLKEHLAERGVHEDPQSHIFVNARGTPLTRFGIHHILRTRVKAAIPKCQSLRNKRISPHTFRHTTAMHLLQSGVDLTVIQSWLGHVQLATTHAYVEIDMDMKRKALSACTPVGHAEDLQFVLRQNRDVISWLESL